MGDLAHLERMGRELKCPICLSLLNNAVSLTCNHIFCNDCVVKSMKSGSNCPVCKVPYRRREIRPAPHMDNLVSVYKSMELASGFNIFLTQTKASDEKKNNVEDNGIFHEKGGSQTSFHANKRVQVPHETPRPSEIERGVKINGGSKNRSNCARNDKREPVLPPFFWLQEENADKLSQLSEGNQFLDITPPNVPTFSDIKDSDDEIPFSSANGGAHGESNAVDIFDSEMFEWTQRPCSPELHTSPIKAQKQVNKRTGRIQGKKSDQLSTSEVFHSCSDEFIVDNENSMNIKQKNCAANEELLVVTEAKSTKNLIGCKKLKRTFGKTEEATLRKCARKNADQDFSAPTDSPREGHNAKQRDDNSCSLKLKKTRRRIKKVDPIASATDPKPKKVRFFTDKADMEETLMVSELPGPSSRKNISTPHINGSLRSKKRKVESIDVQNIDKVDTKRSHNLPHKESPSSEVACLKRRVSQKGLIQANDSQSSDKFRRSTKEVQSIEKINDKVGVSGHYNLTSLRELQEDNKLNRFKCAFCLSSEVSEVSGEMVHYCDGILVGANHANGSKVIHCHKNCAEWAPNVYFEDDSAVNLEAELTRSRRIKCCCCEEKGAALGCYEKNCRKSFHVPCAKQIPQCRWDTQNFVMLCPLHVSSKLPNETAESAEKRKRRVSLIQRQKHCNEILKPDVKVSQKFKTIATQGKMILCCSALTPEERATVSEFERLSGVTVLKNWDSSVTHVIASTDENGSCRRTLKILMGILEGKWILHMKWVKASMQAMKTVEEEQYEITVDIHGIRNGPKLGRQRLLNEQPKIFQGLEFYFTGDFVASYKKYVQDLIVAGGGIILHRKPISTDQASASSCKQIYIVYSLELPEKFDPSKKDMILFRRKTDAEALATKTDAKAVSNSWVLNCIAACKLMSLPE